MLLTRLRPRIANRQPSPCRDPRGRGEACSALQRGAGQGVWPVPRPRRDRQAANSETKARERELRAQNVKHSSREREQLMVLGGGKTGSGSLFPGGAHRPLASESPRVVGVRGGWEQVVKMHILVVSILTDPPHPEVILKHTHYGTEYRDDSSSKVWTRAGLAAKPSSAT
ncbi:hypothetical protein HJG60_008157 [Phyllostomus discolor]|uniref:Uncharacterized protein n=1 Tax=Phyllostomus discolor TaxID=89673 RepID=A0A834DQ28_9CHIR|nr:hypothetical protein HJG60_008157 [Phyllostomus discolor]